MAKQPAPSSLASTTNHTVSFFMECLVQLPTLFAICRGGHIILSMLLRHLALRRRALYLYDRPEGKPLESHSCLTHSEQLRLFIMFPCIGATLHCGDAVMEMAAFRGVVFLERN